MANRRRGWETTLDMLRSLGVVLVPVLVVAGFVALRTPDPVEPQTVDVGLVIEQARAEAGFEVAAPRSLPAGWRATSGEVTPDDDGLQWRLGLLTGDDRFVGLVQAGGQTGERLVEERLAGWEPAGSVTVAGRSWRRFVAPAPEGQRALLSATTQPVTLISTRGSWRLAEQLAATLPPR